MTSGHAPPLSKGSNDRSFWLEHDTARVVGGNLRPLDATELAMCFQFCLHWMGGNPADSWTVVTFLVLSLDFGYHYTQQFTTD